MVRRLDVEWPASLNKPDHGVALAKAPDIAMADQDLLQESRARAGHADDEDRRRAGVPSSCVVTNKRRGVGGPVTRRLGVGEPGESFRKQFTASNAVSLIENLKCRPVVLCSLKTMRQIKQLGGLNRQRRDTRR